MSYDDWQAETKSRLVKSAIYLELQKKCKDDDAGHQVLELVDNATFYAFQKTKTILRHMGEFTLHDGDHLFRVLILMERLLSPEKIEELSVPDLMLLILSAFFHDIGMAPEEKDVLSWKKVWDSLPEFNDELEKNEYDKFKRYYLARPEQKRNLEDFILQKKNSSADLIKNYLISDYIRITHAERARLIIKNDWLEKIKYRDTDLTVEFASICFSHNEDPFSILELEQDYLCGPEVHANLRLVAVILRLADLLDFDGKRTPSVLYSHLFVRHPISLKEWDKHRSIEAWDINSEYIQYHAKCNHPAIEASIHAFCDVIDAELSACNNIISKINDFNRNKGKNYSIKIPFKVDRSKIGTKKGIDGKPVYIYKKTQFNLSKTQVIDLLMGTKLYGDPEVALRELLQNSIDACLLRSALEASWNTPYTPEIHIKYSAKGDQDILEITDNGTGMDQRIIDSYYSKVGSSFYKSSEFYDLKSQSNAQFTPTSRFGIGILSCFMVADTVEVDTRRVYGPHESSTSVNLTIEGQESIFWIKPSNRNIPGTSTKLFLRKNKNPWNRMNENQFINSVENVIPNPPFKILIETKSHKKTKDENSFKEINIDMLRNNSWHKHDNIREFKFEFDEQKDGFIGSVIIALLESHGKPTSEIEMTSKVVNIEGESYSLNKELNMNGNKINESTTSITIDEDGAIDSSDSNNTLYDSISRLSLHGIEVPSTLFPPFWNMQKNQVKLSWPFPILIVIDICGNNDLDLNSSRTQIIMSENWLKFEEAISFKILTSIAKEVTPEYWIELKRILANNTTNEIFIRSLNKVTIN
ncbi:ATP-binding protein [Vibrio splendidus]|uniref:HD domain-containing protein n=1 Tax=Vibrio splendidus TaxID=29497 RepID=UPI001E30BBE3|nr:ATP-binding protein [Vibrio splendidus]MCC4787693.1 ATP-binding protein [Vibrio splendidus]